VLIEPANHEPLSLELELEVAKMIFRNFEVHPPTAPDPHPDLADRLLEMARAYANPRILLREKHAAVASLAIEAIVAMRSNRACEAWGVAIESPYRWFREMVADDLKELQEQWAAKDREAAGWLHDLRAKLVQSVPNLD
jgi:hypothetical protein